MEDVLRELREQEQLLIQLEKRVKEEISGLPEERLKIRTRDGTTEYHIINKDGKEKYLRRDQYELTCALARKTYLKYLQSNIFGQLATIQQFLKNYSTDALTEAFQKLSNERKKLVQPLYLPPKQFIDEWEAIPYVGKGFAKNDAEIITEKKERVRSKSEKMIADKLFMLNIPYKYECPISLKHYGIIYPDFTILDVNRRKEIILEHFGMMDNPEYADKAVQKMDAYLKNGYVPGKNLIITFESSKRPFDVRDLEIMLKETLPGWG